jgi:hypothetical protein
VPVLSNCKRCMDEWKVCRMKQSWPISGLQTLFKSACSNYLYFSEISFRMPFGIFSWDLVFLDHNHNHHHHYIVHSLLGSIVQFRSWPPHYIMYYKYLILFYCKNDYTCGETEQNI